ncbi:hypothetical protein TNCV_1041431 [Trichonephila clavipes]|nr:hypothetical protein TNCV_1041431 [Trichonephila clavipes]
MEKEKLNSSMFMCTQNDITMEIDYNDVINDFAMIKALRKPLLLTQQRLSGQSEARPPAFKSPSKLLVLIYRPTAVGMKGWVNLAHPRNRTRTCGVEARYATPRPRLRLQ